VRTPWWPRRRRGPLRSSSVDLAGASGREFECRRRHFARSFQCKWSREESKMSFHRLGGSAMEVVRQKGRSRHQNRQSRGQPAPSRYCTKPRRLVVADQGRRRRSDRRRKRSRRAGHNQLTRNNDGQRIQCAAGACIQMVNAVQSLDGVGLSPVVSPSTSKRRSIACRNSFQRFCLSFNERSPASVSS
jgi:hypothetical protein